MKYRAVSEHLIKSRSRSEVASFFMAPVHFPELVMDVLIEKHARGSFPLRPAKPKSSSYKRLSPESQKVTILKSKSSAQRLIQANRSRARDSNGPFRLMVKTIVILSMSMFLSCAIAPNFGDNGFGNHDLSLAMALNDSGVEPMGSIVTGTWRSLLSFLSGGPLPEPLMNSFAPRFFNGQWAGLALIGHQGEVRALARSKSLDSVSDWVDRYHTLNEENRVLRESVEALGRAHESKKIYLELNLSDNLIFVKMGSQVLYKFPVVTGKGYYSRTKKRRRRFATPRGILTVQRKERYPVWYPPSWHWSERGREVPERRYAIRGVLGKYRLNLGHSYGIHGTRSGRIRPGKYSHGCIRMNRKDLQIVYKLSDVGTEVYIY